MATNGGNMILVVMTIETSYKYSGDVWWHAWCGCGGKMRYEW